MKHLIKTFTIFFALILFSSKAEAQCISNAGHDTSICATFGIDTVYLGGSPTANAGTPPYTYTWTCNYSILNTVFFSASDFLDDTTAANPRLIDHNTDSLVFYLKVTDSMGNSCHDTVIVHFCGNFVWTQAWNFINITQGDSTTIFPSVTGTCNPLSFQWFPNYNISNPNIENPIVWPDTTTHYYSIVTDAAGCQANGGTFDVFVNPLGLKSIQKNATFLNIYPNPATDQVSITSDKSLDLNNGNITVYNMLGEKVNVSIGSISSNSKTINIAKLSSGFYTATITKNDSLFYGRIVIDKR